MDAQAPMSFCSKYHKTHVLVNTITISGAVLQLTFNVKQFYYNLIGENIQVPAQSERLNIN